MLVSFHPCWCRVDVERGHPNRRRRLELLGLVDVERVELADAGQVGELFTSGRRPIRRRVVVRFARVLLPLGHIRAFLRVVVVPLGPTRDEPAATGASGLSGLCHAGYLPCWWRPF